MPKDINEENLRGYNNVSISEDDTRDLETVADEGEQPDLLDRKPEPEEKKPEEKKEKKGPEIGSQYDDARKRAAEKLKAMRAEEREADFTMVPKNQDQLYFGDRSDDEPDDGGVPEDDGLEDRQDTQRNIDDDIDAQVSGKQDAGKRRLKVNGEIREVTEDELVELAQKQLASPYKFEQLQNQSRFLQQQIAELQRARSENQTAGKTEQPAPEVPDATDEELDDIIDAIQVGDKKEAEAALKKFGDQVIERAVQRQAELTGNPAETVYRVLEDQRQREQVNNTIASFAEKHPQLNASPSGQIAVTTEARRIIHQNLLENGISNEDIANYARQYNLDAASAISTIYRNALTHGMRVKRHEDVLEEAAANIYKAFRQPYRDEPSEEADQEQAIAQRQERKRAAANQQPRRSGVPLSVPRAQKTPEQSRAAAVKRMREQRAR